MAGISFDNSFEISPSLRSKLDKLSHISNRIPKALDAAAASFMASTERQFETEGREKLGLSWSPLSEMRILQRQQKIAGVARLNKQLMTRIQTGNPFATKRSERIFNQLKNRRDALAGSSAIPILTDTKLLRRSMTIKGAAGNVYIHRRNGNDFILVFGSNVDYAKRNQNGDELTNLPKRPFQVVRMVDVAEMKRKFRESILQGLD